MSDADDLAQAIVIVTMNLQSQAAPPLTESEVAGVVDRSQVARTWEQNTGYSVGDLIVPEVRNGHYYVCIQPGTSQGTNRGFHDWPTRHGANLADGTSDPRLIWEEEGEDLFNSGIFGQERNVYDIGRASREGWLLKARKASQLPDNGDVALSQIYEHCMKQADRFYVFRRPVRVVRG